MSVTLETRYLEGFVRPHEWGALREQVDAAPSGPPYRHRPGQRFFGLAESSHRL